MDSQLCIQALVVSLVLVKLTLLTSLFLYWRFQKTYHGFSLWILSFACSAGIQSLYFFRGVIADFWSVGIANILLILSMLLLLEGLRRYNGARSALKVHLAGAAVCSVAVLYYTVVQNQFLPRNLLATGMFLLYTLLIAREGLRGASGKQRTVIKAMLFFLLLDSALRGFRIAAYIFYVGPASSFDSSMTFIAGFIINIIVAIGTAFSLVMLNGARLTEDLQIEKENVIDGQAQLIESQQQLRRVINFSPFPLMVHAEDGEVIQLSEAWTEITGYELADIPQMRDWLARAYGERQMEVMRVVEGLYSIESRIDDGEFVITTRRGEQRIWQFSTAPLGRFEGKRIVISMAADVTERKKAEEQLQQLNQELEAKVLARTSELEDLYNNAPCGYHSLDANGFYVRINDTELKWLGLSREDVVGKRKLFDFIAPEFQPAAEQAFAKLVNEGLTTDIRYELRGVNGVVRQVVGGATAINDPSGKYLCSRSTLFDVSEQHNLDLQNRQRDKMLQAFLDEASDPVHITDHAGRFVYVNQAWLDLLGYSRDETERLTLFDVTADEEHTRWQWLFETKSEGGIKQRSEYVFVDKTGRPLFIETTVLVRYERGEFSGTQAILIDVTARRKIEVALREEQRKLSIANQELERLADLKDDFLASMSHELRTPLTAVIGLAEILRDGAYGELAKEQSEAVGSIEQSGRHLLALINDILDLSKLEARQVVLEMEECSATDLGQASLQFVKSMAAKKSILVDFVVQPDSISLRADPRRLKQMLINLLSNAVKFTPDGGKVGLLIRADRELHRIMFTVWDTGIGIRGEDMGKLFQPFVQIDSSLGRQYAGTGLGLVLVQKAARMHGGQVIVESTFGEGSRFTIELPWHPSCETAHGGSEASEGKQTSMDTEFEKKAAVVLLAEDNPDNVKVVTGALRNKPWRVIVAEDGFKAVELAALHKPDLILMDVQMPNMDGLAAMRLLRADSDVGLSRTPIIALTALAMKGDRERCLRAGADDYIAKPVDFKELIGKMETLLQAVAKQ